MKKNFMPILTTQLSRPQFQTNCGRRNWIMNAPFGRSILVLMGRMQLMKTSLKQLVDLSMMNRVLNDTSVLYIIMLLPLVYIHKKIIDFRPNISVKTLKEIHFITI